MAYPYSSSYLLGLFNRLTGRPAADAITPASKYERLSEAQTAIVTDIATIYPECLYPTVAYASIPTLTTTDNQNFTFGTDSNGFALTPMGKASIYKSLNDIPNRPMVPGRDFIPLGGTMIQIPNNGTYTGTLYWRGISPPGVIADTVAGQPSLFPEGARQLIAYRAAINFLLEAGRNVDLAHELMAIYGRPFGFTPGLFATWMLEWETQWRGGGVLGNQISGLQVAVGSYPNYAGF